MQNIKISIWLITFLLENNNKDLRKRARDENAVYLVFLYLLRFEPLRYLFNVVDISIQLFIDLAYLLFVGPITFRERIDQFSKCEH